MSKLYIQIAVGVAILIGVATFVQYQRSVGSAAERARQEKENAQFRVKVNRGAVSFDECFAADGLYNFSKGTCQLP